MTRHPLAWLTWATAALAAAFIDRNPVIQGLLFLVVVNAWLSFRRRDRGVSWKMAAALAVIPIFFSVVLSRFGRHVIFTLPAIPILGGAWTWDAVAYGASTGLALLLTVMIFGVLQATLRSADLLSLLPRLLYRAGTALALALAFGPQTMAAFQSIREARRLRGQRAGLRAVPALLVPLLLTTLERALQYGESLDARGYGSHQRSRYRPLRWTTADLVLATASLGALAIRLLAGGPTYNPYVDLFPPVPTTNALISTLLLAMPAITVTISQKHHATDRA